MSAEFDIKNGVLTKISNLALYKTPWLKAQQGIVKSGSVVMDFFYWRIKDAPAVDHPI